jgi:hypothetical protein
MTTRKTKKKKSTCIFCHGTKTWNSDIQIILDPKKKTTFKVTVCPKDRETHTIKQLYDAAMKQEVENLAKVLSKT